MSISGSMLADWSNICSWSDPSTNSDHLQAGITNEFLAFDQFKLDWPTIWSTLSGKHYLTTTTYQMNVHPALYMPRSHIFFYLVSSSITEDYITAIWLDTFYEVYLYLVLGLYYVLGIAHLIVVFTLNRFWTLSSCLFTLAHHTFGVPPSFWHI